MRLWPRSLTGRILVKSWLLSVLVIGIQGTVVFFRARGTLSRAAFDRLSVIADLKEDALDVWIESQRDATVALAQLPSITVQASALVTQPEGSPEQEAAHELLARSFASATTSRPELEEIFILTDVGGKVILSTNSAHEGEYRPKVQYFTEGRKATFIENVYASSLTGRPTMTIATPLIDSAGRHLGVLGAHLNLDLMSKIVLSRTGLGEHGEVYLVDRFGVFISGDRGGRGAFPTGAQSEGIDAALHGKNGAALYRNYRGVPVVGAYHWDAPREMACLVELEQSAAFIPVTTAVIIIASGGLFLTALWTAGMYFILRPVLRNRPR